MSLIIIHIAVTLLSDHSRLSLLWAIHETQLLMRLAVSASCCAIAMPLSDAVDLKISINQDLSGSSEPNAEHAVFAGKSRWNPPESEYSMLKK